MALDTSLKRMSAVHVTMPWRTALPFPDSTIAQADRQTVALMCSSILAGAIVTVYNWVIQAPSVADGILRNIAIMADNWQSVIEVGTATSSGGVFEFQASTTPTNGQKRLAFVHNWDGDVDTTSIRGGAAIAEAVEQ